MEDAQALVPPDPHHLRLRLEPKGRKGRGRRTGPLGTLTHCAPGRGPGAASSLGAVALQSFLSPAHVRAAELRSCKRREDHKVPAVPGHRRTQRTLHRGHKAPKCPTHPTPGREYVESSPRATSTPNFPKNQHHADPAGELFLVPCPEPPPSLQHLVLKGMKETSRRTGAPVGRRHTLTAPSG